MRANPKILRLAVLRECDSGKGTSQVAKEFDCSRAWVRRVKQHRRELGKYGPYKTRRRDRYGGPLTDRIKDVIIAEPNISVAEVERVLGTVLSVSRIVSLRQELYVNNDVYWAGSEGSVPPDWLSNIVDDAGRYMTPSGHNLVLKSQVEELIVWRPEITIEQLQRILGKELSPGLVAEAREDIEIRQLRRARDKAARQAQSELCHEIGAMTSAYHDFPMLC